MKTFEEVKDVVKKCRSLDVSPYWATDREGDEVLALVYCNDFFYWGCADAEEVDVEDLPLLQEAYNALDAIGHTAYTKELYCAKKRRMRPQGAYYKNLPKDTWALFNACGPHRDADLGNPIETPPDGEGDA